MGGGRIVLAVSLVAIERGVRSRPRPRGTSSEARDSSADLPGVGDRSGMGGGVVSDWTFLNSVKSFGIGLPVARELPDAISAEELEGRVGGEGGGAFSNR